MTEKAHEIPYAGGAQKFTFKTVLWITNYIILFIQRSSFTKPVESYVRPHADVL
jgi:hypothetical protein